MSICEHKINMYDSVRSSGSLSLEEKLLNIQNELLWGLKYRNYKENEKSNPILPMHSPINIPFELCRARMLLRGKIKAKMSKNEKEMADNGQPEKKDNENFKNKNVASKKRKQIVAMEKPTLLQRNVWSQNEYMDFLAVPNPKFSEELKKKKIKKRCELEPCPPRFIQLAVPNKRRVFANWKDYANFLPAEMLIRFEEILHTDQNLEPKAARYYYKRLDRQKRKELKKKRNLEKKKRETKKNSDWMQAHIEMVAAQIIDYIKDEPLFALNYKQLLLSDAILDRLEQTKMVKKCSRKTKNHYKKTIIEVSDKFAVWLDTLTKFVDVQAIDSDVDIPPLSIASLSEGEYEGESDYESSSEEEIRDSQLFAPDFGEEDFDLDHQLSDQEAGEDIIESLFILGQGEHMDSLQLLIQILANSPDDFLDSYIDVEKMPDVTYRDVLLRLKELRDDLIESEGEKPFLEELIIKWAMQNDPENVDEKILQKIHEVSTFLGDFIVKKPKAMFQPNQDQLEPFISEDDNTKGEEEGAGQDEKGSSVDNIEEDRQNESHDQTESPENKEMAVDGETTEKDRMAVDGETTKDKKDDIPEQRETSDGTDAATAVTIKEEISDDKYEPIAAISKEILGSDGAAKDVPKGQGREVSSSDNQDSAATAEQYGALDEATKELESGAKEVEKKETDNVESKEEEEEGEIQQRPTSFEMIDDHEKEAEDKSELPGDYSDMTDEEGFDFGSEFEEEPEDFGEVIPTKEKDREYVAPPLTVEPGKVLEKQREIPSRVISRTEKKVIKGHKPSKVFEHSPNTVCCLSLKTWAIWLLEITHNAHNWTQWMSSVIHNIREFASIVRGDVLEENGQKKVLQKSEWRKFIKETEESVVAWRQYSAHVKDISETIMENFHQKQVNCCDKCLQDHLITNVVVAHDTLQALTEAISCAAYWQRCLDELMEKTSQLTNKSLNEIPSLAAESDESSELFDIEEALKDETTSESEGYYDIEGFELVGQK
ncbi:hypothetical protein ABEB36_008254 [Hypothenemus hampei]|uniref:Uncharacterized protein n=1 Tax=Hypothenemus hampei TaxID=57062 RepID=A0ABD1EL89_HYPHA